jgi:hypothetical protein
MRNLFNFAAFYVGWFACVGGASYGMSLLGPLVVAAIVILHGWNFSVSRNEVCFIVAALLLGCLTDAFLMRVGALSFAGTEASRALPPAWLISLWAIFATTVNHSLAWLTGRYRLGALFGAVGGPLSYYAGVRLQAAVFPDPAFSVLAIATVWAGVMPALLWLNDWLREALSATKRRPLSPAYAPAINAATVRRNSGS